MSLEPHAAEDIILETQAAQDKKSKLKKHFGRFDMLFFLICTLVGVDTLGAVARNGAQGFTWLIVLALLFFIPYALLTAELGAAFTEEGGAYVWTKLASGGSWPRSTPSCTGCQPGLDGRPARHHRGRDVRHVLL